MYDPKKILTEDGYNAYRAHLYNIEEGLFYIVNHADELHIGALSEGKEDTILEMYDKFIEIKNILKKGDGEKYD
jgi:hypothetical protein